MKSLSNDRFDVLLRERKIPFDKENIVVLNGLPQLSSFLIFWDRKFIENIDWEYTLTAEICLNLLKNGKFLTDEKLSIIRKATYPVTLNSKSLSDLVIAIFQRM